PRDRRGLGRADSEHPAVRAVPRAARRLPHPPLQPRRAAAAGPFRPHLALHDAHDQRAAVRARAARHDAPLAASSRRLRAGLARAEGRLHAPHPLAVDGEPGALARRRPRALPGAVARRDSAARDSHVGRDRDGRQPADRHLLAAARRLLEAARLGAERRRIPDAGGAMTDAPIVDAHAHIFTPDMPVADNAWLKPDYAFTAADYLRVLDAHGVHFGVVAGISIYGQYNDYMIEELRRHPRLRGTVN